MLHVAIWRDLRWRVIPAALLAVVPATLVAFSYPQHGAGMRYLEYIDAAWFRLPGPAAVFLLVAVLLAAGGSLLRPRRDVAFLLALPVSRRRWLLIHVGLPVAALAAVVLAVALILAGGAWHAGVPLDVAPLLARSLAVLGAASVWVCVTVTTLMFVRHPLLAATIVLGVVSTLPPTLFRLMIPPVESPDMLPSWDPWTLADPRSWAGAFPIASLLASVALSVASVMLALHLFERYEP